MSLVSNSWRDHCNGNPLRRAQIKLKRLKTDIKQWKKDIFGNIFSQKEYFLHDLEVIQEQIVTQGYSEELFAQEVEKSSGLFVILNRESDLWKQKSKIAWLKDGDRNSRFFHRAAKIKMSRSNIYRLHINGVMQNDSSLISDHVVNYYKNLFKSDNEPSVAGLVEISSISWEIIIDILY